MKPLKIFFALTTLLLFSSQSNARLIGIDILSESHTIQGSAGYEDNVSYDLTDDEQVSFIADGSSSFSGPDHSEATAGDLDVYTEAAGGFSWSKAESIYIFNVVSADLTLHAWGYSSSEGLPVEAQSSIILTDLTLNQQLISETNIYQPAIGEQIGAGSFYSFNDIYELTLNSDHTHEKLISMI